MAIKVLLASSDQSHLAYFTDAFHEVAEVDIVAHVTMSTGVAAMVARVVPDVVVLDDALTPHSAFHIARELLAREPSMAVLFWVDRESPELLAEALDCGVRAILSRPLSVEDARAKITNAAEWSNRIRQGPMQASEAATLAGPLVALFGAKGGVGTSTLAVQLARMASDSSGSCVLVDFDLGSGDLTGFMDLSHQRSVLDLVPVVDHLNGRYLADALYSHQSGIRVLPGPPQTERADEVTEPIARRVLEALRSYFGVVVVDCGARLDEANAVALELASHALLVITPDVYCLLSARRHLAAFSRLSVRPDDRIVGVVNRQSRRSEFQLPAIRRSLEIPVAESVIPDNMAAFHTTSRSGDPTVVEDRKMLNALRKLGLELGLLRMDQGGRQEPRSARHAVR
jgi:pilus assembly protein CpaE